MGRVWYVLLLAGSSAIITQFFTKTRDFLYFREKITIVLALAY